MKLTILVDNNTFIDQYYYGEPAVSYYIETEGKKILFDTGYSDVLIRNAEIMGIDLKAVDCIAISHSHNDHTRGLQFLHEYMDLADVELVAHPGCFVPKYVDGGYIGSPFNEEEISKITKYQPCKGVKKLTDHLFFLGTIPRTNDFENQTPIGVAEVDGKLEDDYNMDDTALVYKGEDGIFVITGCSHSGICNIVDYAKFVCGDERVLGVLGGFHLFADDEQLKKTIAYLESCEIKTLYPCHCVSLLARAKMMEKLPVVETGVGMTVVVPEQKGSV